MAFVWGSHRESMLQALVLGMSLRRVDTRADLVLAVEQDTLSDETTGWAPLLKAFWKIVPFQHMKVPPHVRATEQKRLHGVYSKLLVWKLFGQGEMRLAKVLMMDVDMLARSNVDEIFQTDCPAGVMRGVIDTCLFDSRDPKSFMGAPEHEIIAGKKPMAGGVNGGLILLQPSVQEYNRMYEFLMSKWKNNSNKMAEQEFLSFWYGRRDARTRWKPLHKKFNFQLHQLFLSNGPLVPGGQSRGSSYWEMAKSPDHLVRIWHYSSLHKPVQCLEQHLLAECQWSDLEMGVQTFIHDMAQQELGRRTLDSTHVRPFLASVIEPCNAKATEEWLEAWRLMWPVLVNYLADFAGRRVLLMLPEDGHLIRCKGCQELLSFTHETQWRDHVLINCRQMRSQVRVSLDQTFDLATLLLPPTGGLVLAKMNFLAAVYRYYSRQYVTSNWCGPLQPSDKPAVEIVEGFHAKKTFADQMLAQEAANRLPQHLREEAEKSTRLNSVRSRLQNSWAQITRVGNPSGPKMSQGARHTLLAHLEKACMQLKTINAALDGQSLHERTNVAVSSGLVRSAGSNGWDMVSDLPDMPRPSQARKREAKPSGSESLPRKQARANSWHGK